MKILEKIVSLKDAKVRKGIHSESESPEWTDWSDLEITFQQKNSRCGLFMICVNGTDLVEQNFECEDSGSFFFSSGTIILEIKQ